MEVTEALRAYRPADEIEAGHVLSCLALAETPASHHRTNYQPGHFTASAFIVSENGLHLLLHHHRKLGRWLQFGGHFEPGESPLEAARREAVEESGLIELGFDGMVFDVDVHLIPGNSKEPPHRHFDLRYLAVAPRGGSAVMDPAESNELRWFDLGEAAEVLGAMEGARVLTKLRTFSGVR